MAIPTTGRFRQSSTMERTFTSGARLPKTVRAITGWLSAASSVQIGASHEMPVPFSDPQVGGASAHLRVRNARASLVTRVPNSPVGSRAASMRFQIRQPGIREQGVDEPEF